MKTIIVGGVAGGATAAARLRRLDENAEIILFEKGEHISFANCGLPYYIGGTIREKESLILQTPESFHARFRVDVRVKSEVIFIDPMCKTIHVHNHSSGQKYRESYDKLILSPGAAPIKPSIPGIDSHGVFTLRSIPDTLFIRQYIEEKKPQNAVIIGGGYIGIEMAENLSQAGVAVSIVDLAPQVAAPLDGDMAAELQAYLQKKGISLYLNQALKEIRETPDGMRIFTKDEKIPTDMALLSIGVRPEISLAENSGLQIGMSGGIQVNENMQTSDPDIYAVGDAVESKNLLTGESSLFPLAGPANRQGRIAADNICGIPGRYRGSQGTSIVKFSEMTAAVTGLNEKKAVAAGISYDKTYTYSASHAAYYPGGTSMSVKILWEKESLRLLGAQIVGFDGVDKRIDVLAAAIRFGAKVTDLTELELSYAPPFSSAKDPVNFAGYVAENVIGGKIRQFFWHDVDKLPRDGSVTLLDIRYPGEVRAGRIDGFINIPLEELRDHLQEIPKGKPVYVHCHSGLRSYIACRILSGHAYDCYNLAGGWRFYQLQKA